MRKILIICLILLGIIEIQAQKYAKQQFTLIGYKVEITDEVLEKLSPLSGNIKAFNDKSNKFETWFVNMLYGMLQKTLSDSNMIFMLPVNSMMDKVSYNDFGYPEVYIEKAIRLSDSKYFLKVTVLLENYNFDYAGKSLGAGVFKPRVSITLDVYNKNGYIPIQTVEGEGVAVVPVTVCPEFLAGLSFIDENLKPKPKTETFKDIVNRAVLESVIALKHRPKKKQ